MFLTPHHHRTYFPYLLAAATLALAGLILLTFGSRFRSTEEVDLSNPVTAVEYQADARAALKGLTSDLALAMSNEERVEILETAQNELLELVVPAEFKDLHLDLVITLSRWERVYAGVVAGSPSQVDLEAIQAKWNEIVAAHPWIE